MRLHKFKILLLTLCITTLSNAQSYINYDISFANAAQHEAEIKVSFTKIKSEKFSFRMSRTSSGRYAIHEFSKNVYNVKATNSKGESLKITTQLIKVWNFNLFAYF
jgi:predicted metalloprotease with PDZ domain